MYRNFSDENITLHTNELNRVVQIFRTTYDHKAWTISRWGSSLCVESERRACNRCSCAMCDAECMIVSGPEMLTQSVHLGRDEQRFWYIGHRCQQQLHPHGNITPCNIVTNGKYILQASMPTPWSILAPVKVWVKPQKEEPTEQSAKSTSEVYRPRWWTLKTFIIRRINFNEVYCILISSSCWQQQR